MPLYTTFRGNIIHAVIIFKTKKNFFHLPFQEQQLKLYTAELLSELSADSSPSERYVRWYYTAGLYTVQRFLLLTGSVEQSLQGESIRAYVTNPSNRYVFIRRGTRTTALYMSVDRWNRSLGARLRATYSPGHVHARPGTPPRSPYPPRHTSGSRYKRGTYVCGPLDPGAPSRVSGYRYSQ